MCATHHDAHHNLPGRHTTSKIAKSLTQEEKDAAQRTISLIKSAAQRAVNLELQQAHQSSQILHEEIKAIEELCLARVREIVQESQEKIATLQRASGIALSTSQNNFANLDCTQLTNVQASFVSEPLRESFQALSAPKVEPQAVPATPAPCHIETRLEKQPNFRALCEQVKSWRQLNNKPGLAESLYNLGTECAIKDQNSDALIALEESIEIAKSSGLQRTAAISLNQLANVLSNTERPLKAIEKYEESMDICKKIGDESLLAENLTNASRDYAALGRMPDAIESCKRGIALFQQQGNSQSLFKAYMKLAGCYSECGDVFNEVEAHDRIIELSSQFGMKSELAQAYKLKGIVLHNQNYPKEALGLFQQSLTLYRELNSCEDVAQTLIFIGQAFSKNGQPREAAEAFNQCIEIAQLYGLDAHAQEAVARLQIV